MRLVAAPDGQVGRADRALWSTRPFDAAFAAPPGGTGGGTASGVAALDFRPGRPARPRPYSIPGLDLSR